MPSRFSNDTAAAPAVQKPCDGFFAQDVHHQHKNRSHLRHTPTDQLHDAILVGFGPASLAISAALHDALDGTDASLADIPGLATRPPRVAILEKQAQFAWHAGMLLPGAKMQITFMKDMATMRNPQSAFTFLNYLHAKGRLVAFANLNTFLPARVEYEDYMRWCAEWFDEVVAYGQEVVQIVPEKSATGTMATFRVVSRDTGTGQIEYRRTKHVVVASGGRPNIPRPFPLDDRRVVHSSAFAVASTQILPDYQAPYRIAVVGSGQSAAEIFDFLHANYPNAQTRLLIKGGALRPSDDSPFVNEIFNPARVDATFHRTPTLRRATLLEDKGTNYGVVRLGLLEHIYETLYLQRIRYGSTPEAEARHWPHRILPYRRVTEVSESPVRAGGVRLQVEDQSALYLSDGPGGEAMQQVLDVDAVFVATGYLRDLHETLLQDARHLMPGGAREGATWTVGRDYRVQFEEKHMAADAGVWLQGCCEATHGLSDTLLSVLATRGGEMVRALFERASTWEGADVLGGMEAEG